jgi:hypothetical protein
MTSTKDTKELLQKAADGGKITIKEAERLVSAGVSASRIEGFSDNNNVNIGSRAQRFLTPTPTPAPTPSPTPTPTPAPTPTPTPTNALSQFRGPGGGFGQASYQSAVNAGYTPAQIASLLPGSGLQAGPVAQQRLSADLSSLENSARQSQSALEQYDARFSELTSQYNSALQERNTFQSQVGSAQAAAQEAKNRADAYEKQQKEQQEFAINEQLHGLRSGATVSGTPGAGLGSLTSGGRSYSSGGPSRPGGILDSYYRSGDLTDSVLNKRGPVVEPVQVQSGGSSAPRNLTSGSSNTAGYYARRFG